MRILFICNLLPWPADSGSAQRTYNTLAGLSQAGDVTLVCPTPGGTEPQDSIALRRLCKRMLFFPVESFSCNESLQTKSLLRRALDVGFYYGHPFEPALFRWYKTTQGKELVRTLCEERYDLVWARHIISMSWLPQHISSRVIVDLDDVQHQKLLYRLLKAPVSIHTPLWIAEYLRLRAIERNLERRPYEFVVCSAQDQKLLTNGSNVWVVPNGIEVPSETLPERNPSSSVLVFVGAMNSEANSDAAQFLVNDIMPLVWQRIPEARILIVGRDPGKEVLRLQRANQVVVTGRVDHVKPYLDQAAASVVPIRFGGGTRIKILESFANGVPVVSTTVGAEGLGTVAEKHLILADSAQEFADGCIRLMRDVELQKSLATAGLNLVRENYDWDVIKRHIEGIVRREKNPTDPVCGMEPKPTEAASS